jgi:hypothetical protein
MIGKGNVEGPSMRWLAPFMMNRVPKTLARIVHGGPLRAAEGRCQLDMPTLAVG